MAEEAPIEGWFPLIAREQKCFDLVEDAIESHSKRERPSSALASGSDANRGRVADREAHKARCTCLLKWASPAALASRTRTSPAARAAWERTPTLKRAMGDRERSVLTLRSIERQGNGFRQSRDFPRAGCSGHYAPTAICTSRGPAGSTNDATRSPCTPCLRRRPSPRDRSHATHRPLLTTSPLSSCPPSWERTITRPESSRASKVAPGGTAFVHKSRTASMDSSPSKPVGASGFEPPTP